MLKGFFSTISIIVSIMLPPNSMADHSYEYTQASKAFNAGDYQTAFHLWSEEAEKGELKAQEKLGAMYSSGKGVQQDYIEAARWYRMAAEQGQLSSQYSLGNMYYKGQGVQKSFEHAYAWWLISAASGNEGAKNTQRMVLGEMTPAQVEKAKKLAAEILQKLAD